MADKKAPSSIWPEGWNPDYMPPGYELRPMSVEEVCGSLDQRKVDLEQSRVSLGLDPEPQFNEERYKQDVNDMV